MKPTSAVAKGKEYERELCRDIEQYLGGKAYRSPCSGAMWYNKADVNCQNNIMQRFHVEAKRQERVNLEEAYGQALRGAGTDKTPIVVTKRNRDISMVYLDFGDWENIQEERRSCNILGITYVKVVGPGSVNLDKKYGEALRAARKTDLVIIMRQRQDGNARAYLKWSDLLSVLADIQAELSLRKQAVWN